MGICYVGPLSLSTVTQPVTADGHPPMSWFGSRFLSVKGSFSLADATMCMFMVGIAESL